MLTCVLEDNGAHPSKYPTAKAIMGLPLDMVFKAMAGRVRAEDIGQVLLTVVITFTDLDETYSFYIRNCILEVTLTLYLQ